MAKDNGAQLCYLLVLILSVVFLVWGFMDLLKKKQPTERTETQVISRQIRGFAFIMISQVVLILGAMICFGLTGGLGGVAKAVRAIGGRA